MFQGRARAVPGSRHSCAGRSASPRHPARQPQERSPRRAEAAGRCGQYSHREVRAHLRLSRLCLRKASFQRAQHLQRAASTAASESRGSRNVRLLRQTAQRVRARPAPRQGRESRCPDNRAPDAAPPQRRSPSRTRAAATRCSGAPWLQSVPTASRCRGRDRGTAPSAGSCRPCSARRRVRPEPPKAENQRAGRPCSYIREAKASAQTLR